MTTKVIASLLWLGSVVSLRDVQLSVPEAVILGSSPTLGCRWSLDPEESLYSVKWYRGVHEFYRFVPREIPHTRVFPQNGISVDVSQSGAQQVVLQSATRELKGRYRCEVSADAPFFYTASRSALMTVVDIPASGPLLLSTNTWISPGDVLQANCSVPPADPPANISWMLNGLEVDSHTLRQRSSDFLLQDVNRIIFSPWEDDTLYQNEELVTTYSINIQVDLTEELGTRNVHGDTSEGTKINETAEDSSVVNSPNKMNVEEHSMNKSKKLAFSQLVLRVRRHHFRKGRINVTCVARILAVWSSAAQLLIKEEPPQIAVVMRSMDYNSGSTHHSSSLIPSSTVIMTIVCGYLFR